MSLIDMVLNVLLYEVWPTHLANWLQLFCSCFVMFFIVSILREKKYWEGNWLLGTILINHSQPPFMDTTWFQIIAVIYETKGCLRKQTLYLLINPFWPWVLNHGNISGLFWMILVICMSIMSHIRTKGVINDVLLQSFEKILKTR